MDTLEQIAVEKDKEDRLAYCRDLFVIEDDYIYLDGNSLGRLPKASAKQADILVTQQWGRGLIKSWNEGWFDAPQRIGAKIAKLIGAKDHEVIVADATTVNLFKLAIAALDYQTNRTDIITDDLNFPSDLYVMQGAIDLLARGHKFHVIPSEDGIHGPVAAIQQHLNEQSALLYLSHTVFKSGYTYDIQELSQAAHDVGALSLWDLSHAVGSVEVNLNQANVDLAVGCTYKYLNGGPGAPAFIYIREDLQEKLKNPIPGWMGKRNLFDFSLTYEPASGLQKFLTGTPPILSLALIEPSLDMMLSVGMKAIREKSLQQTTYLLSLYDEKLQQHGFCMNSPREASQRGSHLSLGHPEGLGIDQAMIHEKGIIPDFRPPDNIRLGVAPLYTTFSELYEAVLGIEAIMMNGKYKHYSSPIGIVT